MPINIPKKYNTPELKEIYLRGILKGFGMAISKDISIDEPDNISKFILNQRVNGIHGKRIKDILKRTGAKHE